MVLLVYIPLMAVGVWLARKMPDGKLKRILLFRLYK